MRRLAPAGNDHAGAAGRMAGRALHRRRQVHQQADRADHALCVVHEPDQLPQVGLPAQVDHPVEGRMVMSGLADLHELDAAAKVIDHLLIPRPGPTT